MNTMLSYVQCIDSGSDPISLTVGEIYEVLPISTLEQRDGWIRIIDNEGEPYLHPGHLFVEVDQTILASDNSQTITVHLNRMTKLKIRDQANARGVSMSALMREIAEEQLDLPAIA